jgi:hypothetical protein
LTQEHTHVTTEAEDHSHIFWGELAPSEHLIQIYEDDDVFLDALEGFVAEGLGVGESVVVIATSQHLNSLEQRLYARGLNLNLAISQDQYMPVNADEALGQFLVDGWPDQERFEAVVTRILARARRGGRRVRAFGEMVALMWEWGFQGGTVRLEHLWNQYRQQEAFALFCAYPKTGFTEDARSSVQCICETHSRVIAGSRRTQSLEVSHFSPS